MPPRGNSSAAAASEAEEQSRHRNGRGRCEKTERLSGENNRDGWRNQSALRGTNADTSRPGCAEALCPAAAPCQGSAIMDAGLANILHSPTVCTQSRGRPRTELDLRTSLSVVLLSPSVRRRPLRRTGPIPRRSWAAL